MTQLFTSDWHIEHKHISKYCKRPFNNTTDMNDHFIKNLYKLWKKGDVLYFLGDLTLKGRSTIEDYLHMFPKNTIFIFGNHDRKPKIIEEHPRIAWAGDIKYITVTSSHTKVRAMLCHYPMRTWQGSGSGSINLHGHSHGQLKPLTNQLDVSIDSAKGLLGEYRPFTSDEIMRIIKENKRGEFYPDGLQKESNDGKL